MQKNPYLVSVYDLVHRPGTLRERVLDFTAPEQLGQAVAVVTRGTPLHIQLRLEGLSEGILATGSVVTTAEADCVRCLDPLTIDLEVDFQELFAYSAQEAYEAVTQADRVDIEPVLRDAVVLALPFQPLCQPDCPGLDPQTGNKLVGKPRQTKALDPRFQALQGFFAEEKTE